MIPKSVTIIVTISKLLLIFINYLLEVLQIVVRFLNYSTANLIIFLFIYF
jgi:hypothetical protein